VHACLHWRRRERRVGVQVSQGIERFTIGEMEIASSMERYEYPNSVSSLLMADEFPLQQVDVHIARWGVSWDRHELGQNVRNGLMIRFVHDWH
jgi:hypothetical protein